MLANKIEKLQNFLLDEYSLNILEEIKIDSVNRVRELIEEVRNSFERLTDTRTLNLVESWIENPQDNCCSEQLDAIAEILGFTYEEINGDCVLVSPSPPTIVIKIVFMSDAEFYPSSVNFQIKSYCEGVAAIFSGANCYY